MKHDETIRIECGAHARKFIGNLLDINNVAVFERPALLCMCPNVLTSRLSTEVMLLF